MPQVSAIAARSTVLLNLHAVPDILLVKLGALRILVGLLHKIWGLLLATPGSGTVDKITVPPANERRACRFSL